MSLDTLQRPSCATCQIRHRAVCARCDPNELERLEGMKIYRSYKAGETIMWRGEALVYVASVVEGVARLSKTMEDGRTQMVGLLLQSDFIGRPGRKNIEFDVIAATDVVLCCFAVKPFEAMIADTPHIAQRLVEMMLDELDSAREWMLLLGRKTAREKIATFLHMLIRRQHPELPEKDKRDLVLPLTREEIADYLGLTLETVSRQLNGMKKDGILSFSDRRRFDVTNMPALIAATGDDT
jgi:CRP/FNR family transcriptional regulator